jgi:glycosyltransferase involved in cell wall biosynthesis
MVNDCAYVGETLIKYLPSQVQAVQIKRSRGIWDKTFGIAIKVLRAQADVFHVHYLLQDCYLALRSGKKPVVGHAHGSDLRTTLKHPFWGRIVRHNLRNCAKILVSTPDILGAAKTFREDAEYLPNPVDRLLFYPKPLQASSDRKKVLIASDSNWSVKGTDLAVRALSKIKKQVDVSVIAHGADFARTKALADSLDLRLNVLPKVPHEKLNEYYWNSDLVIDRFKIGSLGMISLEAIACGRPVVTYVSSEYGENEDFPLKDVNTEEKIAEVIRELPRRLWETENGFLEEHHDIQAIESRIVSIYEELVK